MHLELALFVFYNFKYIFVPWLPTQINLELHKEKNHMFFFFPIFPSLSHFPAFGNHVSLYKLMNK